MPKSKITIGYVHPDMVHADFMSAIIRLLKVEGSRIETVMNVRSGPKIDEARNALFKQWLTTNTSQHFLMLDTDMIPPENTIKKLLGHNKDIVGGLCFAGTRTVKPVIHVIKENDKGQPIIDLLWDYSPNSLVEADAIGTACMMVSRRCAETIWQARGKDHPMPWFAFGMHRGVVIGEDIAFCLTAKKLGFKVFVDTGLEIPHIKMATVGSTDYIRSLMDESHPSYNQRDEIPAYGELVNANSGVRGSK